MKKYNLLVAQSGGPTAAINATLAGVVSEALKHDEIENIYGAVNGIEGVFYDKIIERNNLFIHLTFSFY